MVNENRLYYNTMQELEQERGSLVKNRSKSIIESLTVL